MSLVYWWNAACRGKPKYSERNLAHCHFDYHISHVDWPGIEPVPPPPPPVVRDWRLATFTMARAGERLRFSRKFKTRTRRARNEVLTIHSVQRSLIVAIVLFCTLRVKEMSSYTGTVLSVDCDVNKYFTIFFPSPSNQNHQAYQH